MKESKDYKYMAVAGYVVDIKMMCIVYHWKNDPEGILDVNMASSLDEAELENLAINQSYYILGIEPFKSDDFEECVKVAFSHKDKIIKGDKSHCKINFADHLEMPDGGYVYEDDKFYEENLLTGKIEFIGEVKYDKHLERLIIVEPNGSFSNPEEFMQRNPRAYLDIEDML